MTKKQSVGCTNYYRMGFLLTAALVLQTLLGNAAGEGQELQDNFFSWNYTFYFYDNYTYETTTDEYTIDYYPELETIPGKDLTESAGSSLQSHLPFFVVLLHLLYFLLQRSTVLL